MNALILLGALLLLMILGLPIVFCIGLSSAFFLLVTGLKPLIIISQRSMVGMDSFILLAVPMFTLSGYLMEHCGLSERLVDWVGKLFGKFTGAVGAITLICCAIFAALTGSGPATVAAIGAIMLPVLKKYNYPEFFSAGLLASGGALGPIIPPSVAMIVYGSTMSVSIVDMFIGSIIPGLLITTIFLSINYIYARKKKLEKIETHYTFKEMAISTVRALPVLVLPVIVLGGIYGGIFTPTEAGTICVIYTIVMGIAFKKLTLTYFINALKRTVITSATIAIILGVSSVFGWILAAANIPNTIANALVPILGNASVYLIVLMLLLFVIGCFMETLAAIVILAPLLVPIGLQLGLDPLHLGVVFCVTLIVGFITPPFGVNLFTTVSITGISYLKVVRGVIPFMLAAIVAVLILAFVPDIILFLPNLMR